MNNPDETPPSPATGRPSPASRAAPMAAATTSASAGPSPWCRGSPARPTAAPGQPETAVPAGPTLPAPVTPGGDDATRALLPAGIQPRGLTQGEAAAYCGIAVATFEDWRGRGLMPGPVPGTRRWDLAAIDQAFDKLSGMMPQSADEPDPRIAERIVNGL